MGRVIQGVNVAKYRFSLHGLILPSYQGFVQVAEAMWRLLHREKGTAIARLTRA
jgi:hypothetical protein